MCGGVAFRYTEMPTFGTAIDTQKARLLDGTVPADGTLRVCGSCGQPAYDMDLHPAGVAW